MSTYAQAYPTQLEDTSFRLTSQSIQSNKKISLMAPLIDIDERGFVAMTRKELLSLRKRLSQLLDELPKETLIISKSNGYTQYYSYSRTHQSRKQYISSARIEYAEQLAARDYYELLISETDRLLASDDVPSISDTMKLYHVYGCLKEEKQRLIQPIFLMDSDFLEKWYDMHQGCMNEYEMNTRYDTERGEIVRSKSEKIIADKLYDMKIPYVYESRLALGQGTHCYPDFTVLNMKTRRTWYWEHFGLADNAEYRDSMATKLNLYESNGLLIGDGLIITIEGEHSAFDTKLMTAKIKKYLLE